MAESIPRYEYRIWDDDLGTVARRLALSGVHQRTVESQELYLVSPATERCNAKIRAGLLDLKRLVAETRGLQQWQPILKAAFPLDRKAHAACLACLGAGPSEAGAGSRSETQLRYELAAERRVVPIPITKRREILTLDGCLAEFAAVTFPSLKGTVRHSIAIESADGESVLALAAKLDLLARPNQSYVQELQRLMHLADAGR